MFDRRLISNFDWVLFATALGMSILGILNLYSACYFSLAHTSNPYYLKQLYWLVISIFVSFVVISVDYQVLSQRAYLLHGVSLFLLLAALVVGRPTAGTQRWLQLGGFSFQPSELSKITLVLLLSRYFSEVTVSKYYTLRDFCVPLLATFLTFFLVFLEPDLGTAGLVFLMFFSFVFLVRLVFKHIVQLFLSGVVLLPCAWFFLEDYQKRRVLAFLNPGKASLEAGYHAIQSKIAIGSGMLFGKGFLNGTQSQLRFLPEQHTDFVFSMWAEEWGFVGAMALIVLFFLVLSKALKFAAQARDRLGSFIAIGLFLIFFWQVSINLSMVTGLLPIVGVPLPFISYGGSSLISTWVIVGLLINIKMRRLMF